MKKWLTIALLFYAFSSFKCYPANLIEARLLYQDAVNDQKSCERLIRISANFNERDNPLMSGYNGCATMIMAKHVLNPFSKISFFKRGKQILEKAIAADERNIELRFLRFTVQTNTPSFLGYNMNIEEDKKLILDSFYELKDDSLKQFMLPVLRESKYLNTQQKLQLK